MITKNYKFWFYNKSSKDQNTTDSSVVTRGWTMPTAEDVELYATYEARRIGAYRYEELTDEKK